MSQEIIKWDLSDFYENINDPQIDHDISDLRTAANKFNENIKGKLTNPELSANQLLMWFKEYERILEKLTYLAFYSQLVYSTNNLDDQIKSFHSKIDDFSVDIQQDLVFFELELNNIDEKKYNFFLQDDKLKKYHHELKFIRSKRPHQLSEKEEQLILMKDITGVNGFVKLYNEIKSGFIFDFEVDGKMKKLTESEVFSYMYQADRNLRQKALSTIMKKYQKYDLVFTHIYNNVMKDWDLETKKKKFESPISRRNFQNEISDKAVEILGEVTTKSNSIVEEYYNLKRKILELSELHIFDMYAPVGEISKKYSYNEAIELIKKITKIFHPDFEKIINHMYNKEHIDVTPRKGKNRGAYCEFGKLDHYPYVFVNYVNNIDSVLTLAHELGHAIHAYYIQKEQNFINLGLSLVVAETASIFNEMLTFDTLLKTDLSKEEKISLLCNFLESNFATSHRQNAFYRFEKRIHKLLSERLATKDDIKSIFIEEMKNMFGNSMQDLEKDYKNYIYIISHFLHAPFYVYAYNMSNLLVIALYQKYLEEGEKFASKYIKLLSIGKSKSPEAMLSEIGIDLNDPSFWERGIEYLSERVKELKDLIEN
ncbi:MAG: M3 family oligoendopeptidase [Candidatus Lokiarchaeota archaeon]